MTQPLLVRMAFGGEALPTGGQVLEGSVTFDSAGSTMTVMQGSEKAIVNWNGFSIGSGNSVNFVQPNAGSAILNRVTGGTSTTIAGSLSANGQVYLVNPNGIAITPTGTVKVGGGFVASTLDIDDRDFLEGNLAFHGNGASAGVRNEGVITVGRGGYAALLGGTVRNDGLIAVPMGKVGLGSGEQATLDLSGDGFLQVAVPTREGAEGEGALVENGGTISADGGAVVMRAATAREASRQAINMSGVVEAKTVSGRNGAIVIGGGAGGSVKVSGKVRATAAAGKGGKVEVTGRQVALNGAEIDASGAAGGGKVKIGGDWQGASGTQRASTTSVDTTSIIRADATESGSGGTVVVWSDDLTRFSGLITARGAGSGHGGDAEVSGKAALDYAGFSDLSAQNGRFGSLLLDPYNITISSATSSNVSGFDASGSGSILNVNTLTTALAGANVTVTTGSGGAEAGNITVAAPIAWSAGTTLTLSAAGSIFINKDISATGAGAGLVLTYGTDYSLNNGARVTLSGSSASLAVNGQSYTLIHDVSSLQAMGSTGFYAVANDIDASATASWNGGAGFDPIGRSTAFSGTFSGLGHNIDGLTINRPGTTFIGLFAQADSATLRDMTLSNISVTGNGRVGGLVGQVSNSNLSNIHVMGSVTGFQEAGGIAGWLAESVLSNTSSAASVTVSGNGAGGLVGHAIYTVTISDSYATGAVTAASNAGGLVGQALGGPLILTNVYASGRVTGASGTGGLIGVDADSTSPASFFLNNAYWDASSTGQTVAIGTAPSSTITGTAVDVSGAPRTQATYSGLDFTNTWVMIDGETRPMLRNEYSTVIATPAALQLMSQDLTASYKLGANINMTSAQAVGSNGYYGGLWGASGFVSIGSQSQRFTGIFDGQSHTITGLVIDRLGSDYIGLFGATNGATISNVALSGGSIRGSRYVGGLIGAAYGGSVTLSSSGVSITTDDGIVGGLVGKLDNGTITQSFATGNIRSNLSVGLGSVGGLVGESVQSNISQSFATGNVTIQGSSSSGQIGFGGFVGVNAQSTITDSYATGNVTGLSLLDWLGGFAGVNGSLSSISNSYSTGYVNVASGRAGGFVGANFDFNAVVSNVYWDTETSGKSIGVYAGTGATGLTTTQLQGTLPSGFSPSIWGTGAGLYPYFNWLYPTAPVAVSGIAYSDAGTTVAAGQGVTAVSGGSAIGSTNTGANGYYYVLAAADKLAATGALTYFDGVTAKGAAFSDVAGTNGIQNMSIYGTAAHVITGQSTLGATRANYLAARGSYADTDLSFLSSSGFAPLTTSAGYGVYLNSTGNYTLNGNLGSSGLLTVDSGGTLGVSGTATLSAAGALTLADAISWTDASSVTLATTSSGNINLGGAVTGTNGTLIVNASGTATTSNAVNVGTFRLAGGTWNQLSSTLLTFSATNFVLATGSTFLRATGGDGTAATPYEIEDIYGLQGIGSNSLLSRHFILTADIDASGTANWNSGAGFDPIGDSSNGFAGSFDGAGHTISNLKIATSASYSGLFARTSGTIRSVGLVGASVSGGARVGALVGHQASGTITNSYATGTVTSASTAVGGLVGSQAGTITNSYAAVTVSGGLSVGGLVGQQDGGTISNSFATGAVTASNADAGGLVGYQYGTISNSYATGSVSAANSDAGGLVGTQASSGAISNSYATGQVSGGSYVGGLIGSHTPGATLTSSFWNTTSSGTTLGLGRGSSTGVTGLTTAQMSSLSTFTNAGWDIDDTGGTGKVWRIYDGLTAPLLRGFMTGLTVTTTAAVTKTYDGLATSTNVGTLTYSPTSYNSAQVLGTAGYIASSANAGSYSGAALTLGGLYSTQLGYDLTLNAGSLTINRAALSVTANNASKVYDGVAYSGGNGVSYSGFVNGETASVLGGTLTYGGTSQGASAAGSYGITASGLTSGNYAITYAPGTLTISPANVTLTITPDAASKTYGQALVLNSYSVAGSLIGSDAIGSVSLASAGTAASAGAGTYDITASNAVFSSGSASNYTITYQMLANGLTVNKAALTITANDASKVYDGLAYSGGNGVSYSGFVNGETSAVLGGTLAYGGTSQGAVNAGTYSITGSGLTSGNYDITYAPGTLTVSAATLTVTANNASKVYNGVAYSGGNGVTYSGLVNGETASVLGGTLAYGGTSQGAVNAGTYSITGSGLTSGNYNITYAPGALTVSAAALTVTANNASKVYNGVAYSGGNGVSYSGFVNGETASVLGGTLAYGGTAQGAVNAGTYAITGSGLTSGNYNITYAPGSLTVSAAALTVTANSASKVYDGVSYSGGNGVTYSGFVNGETASVLAGTLAYGGTAQGASAAGSYSITASGLTSGNYDISYAPGTLTISPALVTLTITPGTASKTYGQTLVLNSYSVAGSLISGDTIGSVSLTSGGAAASAAVGTYDITASNAVFTSGAASNYAITYQVLANGLTVNAASLTITANDASKIYDGLAYSGGNGVAYSGFVNGETSAVLDGSLVYGGSAQGAVAAGTYDLTVSGLTARNYAIRYLGGVLMVQAAPSPTVTPQPTVNPQPTPNPAPAIDPGIPASALVDGINVPLASLPVWRQSVTQGGPGVVTNATGGNDASAGGQAPVFASADVWLFGAPCFGALVQASACTGGGAGGE
ncbi:MBG domain-containing protein [Rhizobium sp. RU36D]|uniref:beta strand repeat-containing protein n=1 Tax=Rhizobium sp. RU36D TaxID=1907415 RepID=UPI0015C4850F|nr:MBG domain-containing protein [Rhizobium sp. RU36D]